MFNGVICPIVTAFDSCGEIDYKAQGLLVERLISKGVDGILFCGGLGEFAAVSFEEKKAFFKWAVEKIEKRIWMLAGTGGTNVREMVELTEYCRLIGADGAVVISPYFGQLDECALYSYYASAAEPGLPIVLYNFPERTKVSLSAEFILRLTADFKNIVGIKDTVESMKHTNELIDAVMPVRDNFSVLSGYDEYFISNLISGGSGVLSGLTNVDPEVFIEIKEAFECRDLKKLCELQAKINKLMKIYTATNSLVSAVKYALHTIMPELGCFLRAPFAPPTQKERSIIDEIMKEVKIYDR